MVSHHLLKGKKGIIFGALDEKSIAWKVAERCHKEGAEIILSNAPVAVRLGTINALAEKCNAPVIACDVTLKEDLKKLFLASMEHFGGKVDFILHSIGMSMNMRKGHPYTQMGYTLNKKTMEISATSLHKMLRIAWDHDAINDWGSVVALSFIAAQRVFPDYNEMADAKALLESIARNFGYQYGMRNKVRINTISQSPTVTTAGTGVKGFDAFLEFSEAMSPLGNAPAEACANYCVAMFSDLTKYVTMQNLYHDGGFSFVGINEKVIEMMKGNNE